MQRKRPVDDANKMVEHSATCSNIGVDQDTQVLILSPTNKRHKPSSSSPCEAALAGKSHDVDSLILNNVKLQADLITLCQLSGKQLKLLYRASRDGFEAKSFHAK